MAMADFTGKVLLLGNYAHDQQESMQRFAQMLFNGLQSRGIQVETIRPKPVFGKIAPGGAGVGKWLGYLDKFVIFPRRLKRHIRELTRGEVVHICDHSNAVYVKAITGKSWLVTCHDMLAIRSALGEIPENRTGPTGRFYQKWILNGLNQARRVACVSRATRDDLLRLSSLSASETTIIENGLNYPFKPMDRDIALGRLKAVMERVGGRIPDCFILHVGGNQWYKNRTGAVSIYQELLRRYFSKDLSAAPAFLMVGKPWPGDLRAQVEQAGLRDSIFEIHDATDEDLCALYSTTDALLHPSLMEGFGWPIIEAQACGCPTLTSNVAPMNEIGGDALIFANPRDWSSAAAALYGLLSENAAAKAERKKKGLENASRFSADRMIDRYIEEYVNITRVG